MVINYKNHWRFFQECANRRLSLWRRIFKFVCAGLNTHAYILYIITIFLNFDCFRMIPLKKILNKSLVQTNSDYKKRLTTIILPNLLKEFFNKF